MSVSRIPVRRLWRENERARFIARVDFPTPPFALDTAIIFFTLGIGRLVGRPRCARGSVGGGPFDDDDGGRRDRGRPRGFSWERMRRDVLKHLCMFILVLM